MEVWNVIGKMDWKQNELQNFGKITFDSDYVRAAILSVTIAKMSYVMDNQHRHHLRRYLTLVCNTSSRLGPNVRTRILVSGINNAQQTGAEWAKA